MGITEKSRKPLIYQQFPGIKKSVRQDLKKGAGSWIDNLRHSLKWSLKYFRTFA